MSAVMGSYGRLYINTGTVISPTWTPVNIERDATITREKATADASARGTGGWRQRVGGLKDMRLEFQLVHDADNAQYQALQDAFMDDETIEILALDQPIAVTGAEGPRAIYIITGFTKNESLEDVQTVDVSCENAYGSVPTIHTVTGGGGGGG